MIALDMVRLAPAPVPWRELNWLGWSPSERRQWVAAPAALNFGDAGLWAAIYARRLGGRPQTLSTGVTLVRVRRR